MVAAAHVTCGVGAEICSPSLRVLGKVVAEERRGWRLDSGKIMHANAEGRRWRWAALPAGTTSAEAQRLLVASPASDSCNGTDCSLSPLLLPQAAPMYAAAADAQEGYELDVREVEPVRGGVARVGADDLLNSDLSGICDALSLPEGLALLCACKATCQALSRHLPIEPPPPQLDWFLQYCLLEVLLRFDDSRLPLPMSALYSDMRHAAKRVLACSTCLSRIYQGTMRVVSPACKSKQEHFLRQNRPHHVQWAPNMKSSGFRTLERFSRHFCGERLIETHNKKWRKTIHHSPNVRTCEELLLTRINKEHPLFLSHGMDLCKH